MITYKIKDLNGEIIEGIFTKKNYKKLKILLKYILKKKLFEKIKTNTSLNGEIILMISIVGLINKYNKTFINMSFSKTQLTKNISSRLFYDIINPQNNKKYVIFKYAISKKTCHHVLYSFVNIYDIICNDNTRRI